jgi:hydroxyacylglutathione hydrolase
LQVWPGHGAGSACGKALGAIPSTTLGYEKRFNPAFRFEDESSFVAWLLDGQPEPPTYFGQMKRVNKAGPALLSELAQPQVVTLDTLQQALKANAQVLDLRSREAFVNAHLPGALSIPANNITFTTFVGWLVNYHTPIYLILPEMKQANVILAALRAIGVDNIAGVCGPEVVQNQMNTLPTLTAQQLAERLPRNGLVLLDVRSKQEFCESHIVGARHIPLGYLPNRLADVPHDHDIVVNCATGYRSQIASSLLRMHGFDNVTTLVDGKATWERLLPTEVGCDSC